MGEVETGSTLYFINETNTRALQKWMMIESFNPAVEISALRREQKQLLEASICSGCSSYHRHNGLKS